MKSRYLYAPLLILLWGGMAWGQQLWTGCMPFSPSATPTSTQTQVPTPSATPTPAQINAFAAIHLPFSPVTPNSTINVWWDVQPSTPNGTSALVAWVDVTDNGKKVPNYLDPTAPHTAIYRLGGQPIPNMKTYMGNFFWTTVTGPHQFIFTAGNDLDQAVDTEPRQVAVSP